MYVQLRAYALYNNTTSTRMFALIIVYDKGGIAMETTNRFYFLPNWICHQGYKEVLFNEFPAKI